jgi:membrane protease YdiL (CAAX protease family)
MTTFPLTALLAIFVLGLILAFWVYFFIHSYRHQGPSAWGFGIVFLGILLSGISFPFVDNHVVIFSISFPLAISLIGILWNIGDIRSLLHLRSKEEMLRFIGIGLIYGLLLGLIILFFQIPESFEIPPRYTATALIVIGIQAGIAEELLFRGYFLGYLRRYGFNSVFGNVLQALMFVILHLSIFSDHWIAVVITFLNAVIAGYLTWKNNNLISAFVLHVTFNVTVAVGWLLK